METAGNGFPSWIYSRFSFLLRDPVLKTLKGSKISVCLFGFRMGIRLLFGARGYSTLQRIVFVLQSQLFS